MASAPSLSVERDVEMNLNQFRWSLGDMARGGVLTYTNSAGVFLRENSPALGHPEGLGHLVQSFPWHCGHFEPDNSLLDGDWGVGGCPVHCRIFSSLTGLYPQ